MQLLAVLLLSATVFNVGAQMILKSTVSSLRITGVTIPALFEILSSPMIWVGACLYGFSFLAYIFALSRGTLGQVGPIAQVLTIMGIFAVSVLILREPFTIRKSFAILLSVLGVYLLLK